MEISGGPWGVIVIEVAAMMPPLWCDVEEESGSGGEGTPGRKGKSSDVGREA
jgi:hypothetical protein